MSTQKPFLSAVFTTLGFLGIAVASPADSRAAEPSEAVGTATPNRSSEATPSAPKDEVVLLTDGTVVHGSITYDELGCLIQTPFGSKRFPKTRIDQTFASLKDVYEYKASQFPDEDSEERLKLAQWCLGQKLNEEAKAQLLGVLKLSPTHSRAKAMLEKIQQVEAAKNQRRFDPNIQRAQATAEQMAGDGVSPIPSRAEAAASRRRGRGIAGMSTELPDVFGLPRPLAMKLSDEYGRAVHGILQANCASCHNEHYAGEFRLRQVSSRRDNTRDTLNLNLEMTLTLIDVGNPSKSEILSSALRPHGLGNTKRPIFRSSNDLAYIKLARWVDNVCKTVKLETQRQTASKPQAREDQFGEERAADRSQLSFTSDAAPPLPLPGQAGGVSPRARAQAESGAAMALPSQLGPQDFPSADIPGSPGLRTGQAAQPPNGAAPAPVDPATQRAGVRAMAPPTPPSPGGAANPNAVDLSAASKLQPATAASMAAAASAGALTTPAATTTKSKKGVAIDPSILERALKARNTGQ